jgi:hypothetical protein
MKTTMFQIRRMLTLLVGIGCLLGLVVWSGCQHFEVEVKLEPDGSGLRKVTLFDGGDWKEASTPQPEELRQLFNVTEEQGWRPVGWTPDEDESAAQATSKGYWRQQDVTNLGDWDQQSGDVHIQGSLADEKPYNQVQFSNHVSVEIGEGSLGRTFTFSETYTWTGLQEIVITFLADHFRASMAQAYPTLGDTELAELRGLMAGHLSLGWFSLAVSDELEQSAQLIIQSLASQAESVVSRADPGADPQEILSLVEKEVLVQGDEVETYLEEKLPGFFAVGFTEVNLQVTMPGRVIETNGDKQDNHTVSWKLDVFAVAAGPVQCFARSQLVD